MNSSPQMRVVIARHGWFWLRDAFAILGRNVALWMLFAFTYLVTLSVLSAVPYIGPFIFLVTTPAFTLSFTVMARESEGGRTILPALIFAGFRRNTMAMLILGAMYAAGFIAVAWMSTSLFGDTLSALMRGRLGPDDSPIAALIGSCAFYLPVLLAFWFAPPLVGWHDMSAPKAAFFSLFAALRNWRAMLVYGIVLLVLWGIAAALLAGMLRMFGPEIGPGPPTMDKLRPILMLATIVATPLALAGFALQLITYYTSYRDVFLNEEPVPVKSA
ncbi:MAG: BPSS1780 family membrane protein [Burkholderiales bacterium]